MTEKKTVETNVKSKRRGPTQGQAIDRLKALDAPLASDQAWSTYVGSELLDGHTVSFDGTSSERRALEHTVRLSMTERDAFVVCVPKRPHYAGRVTPSLRAGYTVMKGDDALYLYQSVLYADLDDNAFIVADTPTATYVAVSAYDVTAWDMTTSRKAMGRTLS